MSTHQRILDAVKRARAAVEAGKPSDGASQYQLASRLMTQHAGDARTDEDERYRKAKALEYREKARSLAGREGRPQEEPLAERGPGDGDSSSTRSVVSSFYAAPQVGWDDIGGLEGVKQELKFTLALSLAAPPEGVKLPVWRNLLFYGPPGTGKTLLAAATAKAVADLSSDQCAFFNVKVSSVMSKYFGESSKIISELYAAARNSSPSVVFFDEFESLTPDRDSDESGPAMRILSTILAEMDGLAEKGRDNLVITIAATNLPWKMDSAVLSRFEKRILIPPPDQGARQAIFQQLIHKSGFLFDGEYKDLAAQSEGYTGRELQQLCKRALNTMILEQNSRLPDLLEGDLAAIREHRIATRSLRMDDFTPLFQESSPSVTHVQMKPYLAYQAGE